MDEITKGKKSDETVLDDPQKQKDQESSVDNQKKDFLDEPDKEEAVQESTVKLEDPPTYDTIEQAARSEKEEQTKIEQMPLETYPKMTVCRYCGTALRDTDRFCPSCGKKCAEEETQDMTAATRESEPSETQKEETKEYKEEFQEEVTESVQPPRIDPKELQKRVEQAEKELERSGDWQQTEGDKQIQGKDDITEKLQEEIAYTEEERRQQVLRMAQQDINYERQLAGMNTEEEKPKKKRKTWKIVLCTVFALLLLSAAGIYAAGVYHFQDRFFLNTTINGVDVSENTVEEVNQYLADEIAKYQIAIKERDGVTEYLTSAELGYGYTPIGGMEQLKENQNPFLWPLSFSTTYLYTITPNVSYSEATLKESVANLACFQEENIVQPQNAYVKYEGETYQIVPEVEGNLLDQEKVTALIKNAVETGATEISLEETGCYIEPERRQDDAVMNSAVNQLNTYLSTNIEYIFGDNREVLDASIIKDWISFDETTFEVSFDDAKLTQYVASLAKKYDTYNKDRQFTTNDGSVVTVSGGSGYGWMIDQEAEVQEVKQWIAEGTQNIRYALFAQEAVSWYNCDLGDSYIEIDLTNQHVWLYIDGKEIVSTDCVSGDMTIADRMTPGGTYTLYYKESPSILKGEGYEDGVEVQYWMPFNGGIGLHDASWRTEFGGNIYISNGSHGCVNLPSSAAKTIYDNIYPGIPIICYYR